MNLEKVVENSHITFESWRETEISYRQDLLKKLSQLLELNKKDLAEIITREMGKPISQSLAEVEKSAQMIHYYAELKNVLEPEVFHSNYRLSKVYYEPKGVILGVMPWNFPFWQVLRFAVPSILAGNSILLKHASLCFESGEKIQELFLQAGFDKYLFQNLKLKHSEIEILLENPKVRGVSLTGSEKAGSFVASLAGKNLKKSLLELGGSDAFIVLNDADLALSAREGALSRLQNCGQTCVAAKRFIIQEEVYEDFMELFKMEFKNYVPNNPFSLETKIAGMSREDLADELEGQYKKALDYGAEIIVPLQRIDKKVFMPGILLVGKNNPILKEEVFGPLALVLKAKTDEDALEIANDTPFGLAGALWTKSLERQEFFIKRLEVGTLSINRMTRSEAGFPFVGRKNSGYGVELSYLALKEFVDMKMVVIS